MTGALQLSVPPPLSITALIQMERHSGIGSPRPNWKKWPLKRRENEFLITYSVNELSHNTVLNSVHHGPAPVYITKLTSHTV